MRFLTTYEIENSKITKLMSSMNISGLTSNGEVTHNLKLERIRFKCDAKYIGICSSSSDDEQTGYKISLVTGSEEQSVYVTECFESEVYTLVGCYAGSAYMYNTLSNTYVKDYTNIELA